MFPNFRVELTPRAIGNEYRNMEIAIFERQYAIVVLSVKHTQSSKLLLAMKRLKNNRQNNHSHYLLLCVLR
jgi:hypothetical protein